MLVAETPQPMRALVVATLALVLVAGCSGSGGGNPSGNGSTPEESQFPTSTVDVKPTATTGIIRGVVVDQAIRPIAGVTITIAGQETSTQTNTDGAFGFEGLQPGTYFLVAHKQGYSDLQASTDVVAGVADPEIVRIKLLADPSSLAFVVPYVFNGYIECSTLTVVVGAPLCDFLPNTGVIPDDNNRVFYTFERPPTRVQSEMVWKSNQQLGDKMKMSHAFPCTYGPSNNVCDHGYEDSSPIVVISNDTTLAMAGSNYPAGRASIEGIGWGNGTDFQARVFAGNSVVPDEVPNPFWGVGVVFEQPFDIYTHVFYGYEPPEGWTFGTDSDGEAPAPPS